MIADVTIVGATGIAAVVSPFGARLVELRTPDRDGRAENIVLGFDDEADYRERVDLYFGATVGPIAGRVAGGRFRGGGLRLDLAPNEGSSHLHGGSTRAFDRVVWDIVDTAPDAVELRHTAADGEDGYPGDVVVHARYRLVADTLRIEFTATSTKATPMNLVNHTYFNLSGNAATSVTEHSLAIAASSVLATDEHLLPTGGVLEVDGTAFDYRVERRIGDLLPTGGEPWPGVDTTYLLDAGADVAAVLHDPASGRTLTITTSEPTLQVYTGNRIPVLRGRSGSSYRAGSGICLEAQRVPDAPELPDWPTIVLPAGETYRQETVWQFGTRPLIQPARG